MELKIKHNFETIEVSTKDEMKKYLTEIGNGFASLLLKSKETGITECIYVDVIDGMPFESYGLNNPVDLDSLF